MQAKGPVSVGVERPEKARERVMALAGLDSAQAPDLAQARDWAPVQDSGSGLVQEREECLEAVRLAAATASPAAHLSRPRRSPKARAASSGYPLLVQGCPSAARPAVWYLCSSSFLGVQKGSDGGALIESQQIGGHNRPTS